METLEEIKYSGNALIVQGNKLIRSVQDELGIVEAKLIKLIISQIAKEDIELRTYTCHASDLARYLGIAQDNLYRDIQLLASSIMKKSIYIIDEKTPLKRNGKPNYEIFNWVDYFKYTDGVIEIRLSDKLKPFLLAQTGNFTQYCYGSISKLPTSYAIQLLELLASFDGVTKPNSEYNANDMYAHVEKEYNELIFSINDLKKHFNCLDKYPNNNDFIKRIIAPSVNAVNAKSVGYKVTYRIAKEGRRLGYVLFKVNAWDDVEFTKEIGIRLIEGY